ncbi:MAG: nuclear transport factor 2 family protein [Alphaproteobacteria bacterium]
MSMHDNRDALATRWLDAWNSRDLERILALYAEDCEMASPNIATLGLDPSGRLRGKTALRHYWGGALARLPQLHFTVHDVYVGPDSVIIHYTNDRRHQVCEYLRCDASGLIVQATANHRQSAPDRAPGPSTGA